MVEICFLGVEGGYPYGGNQSIGILVRTDEANLLLDCGAQFASQIEQAELKASEIDSVYVSHVHSDHSAGIPLLLFGQIMDRFLRKTEGAGRLDLNWERGDDAPLDGLLQSGLPGSLGRWQSLLRVVCANLQSRVCV